MHSTTDLVCLEKLSQVKGRIVPKQVALFDYIKSNDEYNSTL